MLRWSHVTVVVVLVLAVALATTALAAYTQGLLDVRTLVAGKNINAGTVEVGISGSDLCVFYDTNGSWDLESTHLYLGLTAPGKSAPGQFPYKHEYLGGSDTDQFCVPLSEIGAGCGDRVYIAAHAVVSDCSCREETAWACGSRIRPGKNWATYFSVVIPCDD